MHQTTTTLSAEAADALASASPPTRGIEGWALGPIVTLDEAAPGLLRRIVQGSDLRRQAVFLALAEGVADRPQAFLERHPSGPEHVGSMAPLTRLATIFAHARVRSIVAAALDETPMHLVPLLGRMGPQPLPQDCYGRLCALAADEGAHERVQYLLDRRRITATEIDKAERLRPEVLLSKLASRVYGREDIARVNGVIQVALQACSATATESLAQSLRDVGAKTTTDEWLYRIIRRFDGLPVEPPWWGDDEAILLGTGAAMEDAGRRYRNCLASKLPATLGGRTFFYEFPRLSVLAEVQMLTDGTGFVEYVHGPRNQPVDEDVAQQVREKLSCLGMPSPFRADDQPELQAVAGLRRPYTFRDMADDDETGW